MRRGGAAINAEVNRFGVGRIGDALVDLHQADLVGRRVRGKVINRADGCVNVAVPSGVVGGCGGPVEGGGWHEEFSRGNTGLRPVYIVVFLVAGAKAKSPTAQPLYPESTRPATVTDDRRVDRPR